MKLLLLVLLPACCSAQGFATLETEIYNTKDISPGSSIIFTGGGYLKGKNDRSLQLGAGIGVYIFSPDNIYFAPFIQTGYFNPKKKISPYVNARVGYGFYNGSGTFAEVHSNKGGMFTDIKAGAGFKVGRVLRITPTIGITGAVLRYVINKETIESHFVALPHAGVVLMFAK